MKAKTFMAPLFLLALLYGFANQADEGAEATVPDRPMPQGTSLITNKRFITQNRVEFGLFMYDVSVLNKFVNHPYGLHAGVAYHFLDSLALEAMGGYVPVRDEVDVVKDIRAKIGKESGLPGLWQTDWFTGLHLQWAPVYGKLSILSEADLGFQFYGLVGGGLEGIRRAHNDETFDSGFLRWTVSAGAGLRIFMIQRLALRFEFRNAWGLNPGASGGKQDKCPDGFLADNNGTQYCAKDIASTSWLGLGLSLFI